VIFGSRASDSSLRDVEIIHFGVVPKLGGVL
jgi:hypothetical protein